MNILINSSNLKKGGGLQVADSFIRQLHLFKNHTFYVVLSDNLSYLEKEISNNNIQFCNYSIKNSILKTLFFKDKYLDSIVAEYKVDAVFTIFGPSLWKPKVPHICGFARSQIIYRDSPFFKIISSKQRIKYYIKEHIRIYNFKHTANAFYTENKNVTEKLKTILNNSQIYTVTNYYNQVFDNEKDWDKSISLPAFDGITILSVAANYLHKNLNIIPSVIDYLKNKYPFFNFRFILTINERELHVADKHKQNIVFLGKVNINQCPYLYQQCNIMFMPTLIECFTASYPEAMKMQKPIITSDLDFAHGLCGNAAMYFDPLSPKSIGDSIYTLANNKDLYNSLVKEGLKQLTTYDNYTERAEKYIAIIEETYKSCNK